MNTCVFEHSLLKLSWKWRNFIQKYQDMQGEVTILHCTCILISTDWGGKAVSVSVVTTYRSNVESTINLNIYMYVEQAVWALCCLSWDDVTGKNIYMYHLYLFLWKLADYFVIVHILLEENTCFNTHEYNIFKLCTFTFIIKVLVYV